MRARHLSLLFMCLRVTPLNSSRVKMLPSMASTIAAASCAIAIRSWHLRPLILMTSVMPWPVVVEPVVVGVAVVPVRVTVVCVTLMVV